MMTGYVSKYFPSASRATALGLAMGVGRLGAILGPIIGGYMIALQLPYIWSFYVFAICGLLALLATLLIPKHPGGKVLGGAGGQVHRPGFTFLICTRDKEPVPPSLSLRT